MTAYNSAKTKFLALSDEPRGIAIMFAATFLFSTMGFFIKLVSVHHTTFEIVFFRNIVSLVILAVSMYVSKPVQKGGRPMLLVMRGVFGFFAMFCYFYSIQVLPLASASTFNKTSPIFTAIFAGLFLKEKTGVKVWAAVLVGFAGVLLIMRPSHEVDLSGAIAGLMGGMIAAMAYTSIKELAKYYDARVIVVSFSVAGISGALLYFAVHVYVGDPRYLNYQFIPQGIDIVYIVLIGTFAAMAQWMMSVSYKYGRASVLSTIGYFGIVFATVYGFIGGDGWPGFVTLGGISLVGISGILVGLAKK